MLCSRLRCRGVCRRCCRRAARRRRGPRHPERRHGPGVPQAGRAARCGCWSACRSKAMRDMDYPKPRGTTNADLLDLGRADATLRDAATLWIADYLELYENDDAAGRADGRRGARLAAVRQVVRVLRRGARPRHRAAAAGRRPSSSGARGCSTCCSSTRSSRTSRASRFDPRLARLGIRTLTVLRFLPPGGAVRALRVPRRSRARAARSALAPGGAAVRQARVLPHPRRHRPPAVPVLPGDPVPPLPLARRGRHRVHRRAFDHADRVGLQPRARRAVVPAADRDADRGVDRLHGAREHRRRRRCSGAG